MKLLAALLFATGSILAAGTANAQASTAPAAPVPAPDVTVRGPERLVCRSVTRTATRMRSSRVCRRVSEVNADDARSEDERMAEAEQTLDVRSRAATTLCTGGMGGGHNGPLGPR